MNSYLTFLNSHIIPLFIPIPTPHLHLLYPSPLGVSKHVDRVGDRDSVESDRANGAVGEWMSGNWLPLSRRPLTCMWAMYLPSSERHFSYSVPGDPPRRPPPESPSCHQFNLPSWCDTNVQMGRQGGTTVCCRQRPEGRMCLAFGCSFTNWLNDNH